MSIEHRLDPSGRVLWTTMTGDVFADDIRRHFEAVQEMHGQPYREIIDARLATPRFGARDLPKLAQHGRALLADGAMAPRAIVVHRQNLVSFGLARMFAALATPWVSVRVFDDLPAAVAYIDAVIATGL